MDIDAAADQGDRSVLAILFLYFILHLLKLREFPCISCQTVLLLDMFTDLRDTTHILKNAQWVGHHAAGAQRTREPFDSSECHLRGMQICGGCCAQSKPDAALLFFYVQVGLTTCAQSSVLSCELCTLVPFQAGLAGILGLAGSGNVQVRWLSLHLLNACMLSCSCMACVCTLHVMQSRCILERIKNGECLSVRLFVDTRERIRRSWMCWRMKSSSMF